MKEQDDIFEAYNNGLLSKEEHEQFERRLNEDPNFKKDYEAFLDLQAVVQLAGEEQLRETLSAIHEELDASNTEPRVRALKPWRMLSIAASIVVLIGAYFFFQSDAPNSDNLYAEYITPYHAPDKARSTTDESRAWQNFAKLYQDQAYREALVELDKVGSIGQAEYLVELYRGVCLLLSERPAEALLAFEKTLASDNDHHGPAHWYSSLALLKTTELDQARSHLEQVVANRGFKQKEARALLAELEELLAQEDDKDNGEQRK